MINIITRKAVRYINKVEDFDKLKDEKEVLVLVDGSAALGEIAQKLVDLKDNHPNAKVLVF